MSKLTRIVFIMLTTVLLVTVFIIFTNWRGVKNLLVISVVKTDSVDFQEFAIILHNKPVDMEGAIAVQESNPPQLYISKSNNIHYKQSLFYEAENNIGVPMVLWEITAPNKVKYVSFVVLEKNGMVLKTEPIKIQDSIATGTLESKRGRHFDIRVKSLQYIKL